MGSDIRVKWTKGHITQEELAAAVDVSRQTIYAVGHLRYGPSLELTFKLARYFDYSVRELFTPEFDG